MWQEESEATNASSGSTPAASDQGARDDMRAGARRNDRAAVEHPFVRAAVLALGEASRLSLQFQRIVAV